MPRRRKNGLARRFAPLRKRFAFVTGNDGKIQYRVPATRRARVVDVFSALKWRAWRYPKKGAGNAGCRWHPRPRV
jgi:hypothetical protein